MDQRKIETLRWFAIVAVAVGLTVVFWSPLWTGGGFVGGDIYSYFLPQKAYYAEHLKAGEFPLWNNRTGFGYPIVGESQTGAFYPINLALYLTLELNTAYHAGFLLHYLLAFLFTALYTRRLGLGLLASILAATVYVYGWFPARCSLEWAIVGGTWMPLVLWSAESFLQTRRWRFLTGVSFALAVQLLAGHFSLAFITQLTLAGYIGLRLMWHRSVHEEPATVSRRSSGLLLGGAIGIGFLLAAVQLFPTWELKQQSQRLSVSEEHDPGYGHIPPMYLSQAVASWWFWHSPEVDVDRALSDMKFLALNSRTNKTEAHLYFGLLPLALAVVGFFGGRNDPGLRRIFWIWCLLSLSSAVYATGLLLPVARHLPGFSFFEGLGRYGIATTFAVAIMSAIVFDQWSHSKKSVALTGIVGVSIVALTVWDLRIVGQQMAVSVMVPSPPADRLVESPLRKTMTRFNQPQRMFAPGPNLPNLLGQSAVPVYLGLGPAEYFDPEYRFPESADVSDSSMPLEFSNAQQNWVDHGGVTHVVSFERRPATDRLSDSEPINDPFLNQAWGRRPDQPVFIQRVLRTHGRVGTDSENATAQIVRYSANTVEIEADVNSGEAEVFLRDLFFPGWSVSIDDQPAEPMRFERLFRSVNVPAGKHRIVWKYKPSSLYWGALVSLLSIAGMLAIAVFRRRSRSVPSRDSADPGARPKGNLT